MARENLSRPREVIVYLNDEEFERALRLCARQSAACYRTVSMTELFRTATLPAATAAEKRLYSLRKNQRHDRALNALIRKKLAGGHRGR